MKILQIYISQTISHSIASGAQAIIHLAGQSSLQLIMTICSDKSMIVLRSNVRVHWSKQGAECNFPVLE